MSAEEQIKELILRRYGTVKRFCDETGVGYNTLISILRRGVSRAGVSSIFLLCSALHLDANAIARGEVVLLTEPGKEAGEAEKQVNEPAYTAEEKRLVARWREQTEMQAAVKRLLRMD